MPKQSLSGKDQQVVRALEQTVTSEVTKGLPSLVHEAVMKALVVASNTAAEGAAPKSNGDTEIRRPKAGGRCAAVWDELDKLAAKGQAPTLKQIQTVGKRRKWNENNTRIEFYQWRHYNGLRGRAVAGAMPLQPTIQ